MKNKKVALIVTVIVIFLLIILASVMDVIENKDTINGKNNNITNMFGKNTFNIIASQENEDIEEVIQSYFSMSIVSRIGYTLDFKDYTSE